MATLEQTLANNQYKDLIIPIIGYLNDRTIRSASPWEFLAIADAMVRRMRQWNSGALEIIDNQTGQTIERSGENPGSPFRIINGAADAGAENPYNTTVNAFIYTLNGLTMDSVNAWVDFNKIHEVFFENTSFIYYFTNRFYGGAYASLYLSLLGGEFREGYNGGGIIAKTIAEGSNPSTKATTEVFIGASGAPVGSGAEGPYFSAFSEATRERVFWFEIDGDYIEPVLTPAPGTTITYHQVTLAASVPESDMATAISVVIDATGFFDPVVIDLANEMTISASITGSLPTGRNDYTAPPGTGTDGLPTPGKIFTYTDGTSSVAHKEMTSLNFNYAVASSLIGKWFRLFNGTDKHLFYYEEEGSPVDPTSLGVAYDFAYPISRVGTCCITCPKGCSCCTKEDKEGDGPPLRIQNATESVIASTGLWTVAAKEKCCECDCCPPNLPKRDECCGNPTCDTQLFAVASIASDNVDPGTAGYGAEYQVNDVLAPDGTNLGTAVDDNDFANLWNLKVVPHMAAKGVVVHYFKPISTGFCCLPCCCQDPVCIESGNDCYDCPDPSTAKYGSPWTIVQLV